MTSATSAVEGDMTFLNRVLEPPQYGFVRDGQFVKPTQKELLQEFGRRLNIFESRKNWMPFMGWTLTACLSIPLFIFIFKYFSWPLVLVGFVYSMVLMGSHGTFWLHRYGTHRAYRFKYAWVREICRNLVIKIIPEEIYVVSHHVHHRFSEKPGDPYNVHGGWLYCFLGDANHQMISRTLTRKEYAQAQLLVKSMGIHLNTYEQYQRWGTLAHPGWTVLHYALNWGAWFGIFWLIGGPALATAIFGSAAIWGFGVRTFNFEGHGQGKDRRRDGIDFNREDLSVNQTWPGYVSGEWHNNHHLYARSARAGFLPYQLDIPWIWIRSLQVMGLVDTVHDDREAFMKNHYLPYLAARETAVTSTEGSSATAHTA